MELLVFDLDGTLLGTDSRISKFTGDTLSMLRERGIRYTAATGRTLHAADSVLNGHYFNEPIILKNGVLTYDPINRCYIETHLLEFSDINPFNTMLIEHGITPFVFTIDVNHNHAIYHRNRLSNSERKVLQLFGMETHVPTKPLEEIPVDIKISNVSAIGPANVINKICNSINSSTDLVAYSGKAIEDSNINWMDIHHAAGSKSRAVKVVKEQLGIDKIICFGDSDNDLSLFLESDEAYAPENAKQAIKDIATAVISHHQEDGVARFLRSRFELL